MQLTKEWFKKCNPCHGGVKWFLNNFKYGARDIDVINKLIEDNELCWANWTIVRCMKYKQYVSYAVYAAEQVLHIYEARCPDDDRPRLAIAAAVKCIENPSKENKQKATDAAEAAADAYDYVAAAAAYAAADAADTANEIAADAAEAAYSAKNETLLNIINYGLKLIKE